MKNDCQKSCWGVGALLLLAGLAWFGQAEAASYGDYVYPPGYFWDAFVNRFVQHLIAAIFGATVGFLLSDKARVARRHILLVVVGFCAIFGTILHVFLGNIAFFLLAIIATVIFLREEPKPKGKSTTFGSAEWADYDHLQKNGLIGEDMGEDGFHLGVFRDVFKTSHPLHYTGDRHLLTIAPTRSGKGVCTIIPNLLTYQGSAVVIDPKGENAMITAKQRGQGLRQTVHVVDPWGITGLPSSRFNPLDWLDPADSDINENAMILADAIVAPHAGSRDQFWDEEAKGLLMGILLYVALDEQEQNRRNLGRVRDIISLDVTLLNPLLSKMAGSSNLVVSSAGARTLSKEDKLKSNLLASLQAHTHFLDSPRMRESLAASDFRFEDLKTSRMTLYLVLPSDRLQTFGRWLRLLIQQALTINARNIDVQPDKPILFLLDEMAALGRLSMIEQAYGLMAGFGMQLWGIVQDLSQLERIYGKGWQTFIGNSGVLQYFGSRDLMTAEYFSKLCGVTTIEKKAFSFSFSQGFSYSSGNGSSSQNTESTSMDVVQRNLVYPDELMVLRDNKELLFVETSNPIQARKVPWFEDEALRALGINLRNQAPRPSLPNQL